MTLEDNLFIDAVTVVLGGFRYPVGWEGMSEVLSRPLILLFQI